VDNENIKKDNELNFEELDTAIEETIAENAENFENNVAEDVADTEIGTVDEETEEAQELESAETDVDECDCEETGEIVEMEGEETSISEEVVQPAKKSKATLIGIIAAVVVVVIAAVAVVLVFGGKANGEKTVVNTPMVASEENTALDDNVEYENPVMALLNNFTDKKEAVMVINGKAVDKKFFQAQTNNSAANCVASLLQTNLITTVKDFDWDALAFDGELSYKEYAKGMATSNIIPVYAIIAEGEKKGIVLDEADEKEIASGVEEIKKQYGDDFEKALKESGIPDEETFLYINRLNYLSNKVVEDFNADPAKYVSAEEVLANEEQEMVTAKHILIAFAPEGTGEVTDEMKAEAKKKAEEVLAKVKGGEDFDKLSDEYNDDPGVAENPDGYTFADDGTMVQEFTDAAFALEIGGTSDLVETNYGYHIIRRVDRKITIQDYVRYLNETVDVKVRKKNFMDIDITVDLDALFGM